MTAAKRARLFSPVNGWPVTTTQFLTHTVDANNDGVGFIFQALSADPITHIGFRYGVRTGDPPALTVGLQGVSTTAGTPSGTYLLNGGSDCKVSVDPPNSTAWDGLWQWAALDFAYTPTMGELMSAVILGGTTDAGNFSTITTNLDAATPSRINLPFVSRLTGGTWSNTLGIGDPAVFGWRTASGRFGNIMQSLYTTRTATTVGHRVAMKVNIPTGWFSTYKVAGIRYAGSLSAATGKSPLMKIWNSGGALASLTIDTEQQASGGATTHITAEHYFTSLVTLNAGTDYYFGFEVADAANGGIILYGHTVAEVEDAAESDGGANCCMANYTGSWSPDTLTRPWMELILDDITAPSGGGGLVAPIISGMGGLIIR